MVHRILSGLALAALLGPAASSVRAQSPPFNMVDIRQIDRSEIELQVVETDPPVLREGEAFLNPRTAPPSPDPSLARPVSRLGLDAAGIRELPMATTGSELRVAAPLIELTVGGYAVRMAAIEVKTDRDFEALHYTLLDPGSNDFARLTVSRSGPEVVGTVFINDEEFRILPDFDDEYQLVHHVVAYSGGWRREDPPILATRAGQLEARHLQVGWIADHQPGKFDTLVDGRPSTYADGPTLGKLNFWSAFEFDAAGNGTMDDTILATESEIYLNSLSYFTWVYDPIGLRIDWVDADDVTTISNEGLTVRSYQLINDIPISEPLVLHMGPSGDVLEFDGTLMRRDMAPATTGERIIQSEARATARIAIGDAYRVSLTDEIVEEELFYNAISLSELELIWRIAFKSECGMIFRVDVNAVTGETSRVTVVDFGDIEARSTDDALSQCRYLRYLNLRR